MTGVEGAIVYCVAVLGFWLVGNEYDREHETQIYRVANASIAILWPLLVIALICLAGYRVFRSSVLALADKFESTEDRDHRRNRNG